MAMFRRRELYIDVLLSEVTGNGASHWHFRSEFLGGWVLWVCDSCVIGSIH